MAYEEFSGELDKPTGFVEFDGKLDSQMPLPEGVTPSTAGAGRGSINPPLVKPRDDRGIIQRVGEFFKPEPKSVMEGYTPSAEERQAEIDQRLSLGAGPISQATVAKADLVRSGVAKTNDAVVQKAAEGLARTKAPSFGDLVDRATNPVNVKAARDAKADEFRSAGEWAVDTLSNVAQGVTTLAQLPINIIAPSSQIAQTLRDTQKELQAQESDVTKAQRDALRERVMSEDGFLDKYTATVVELVTNPGLALAEAAKQVPMFLGVVGAARVAGGLAAGTVGVAGKVSPTVALGEAISGNALQAAARAGGTTAGGVGASMVMAGGDAAGSVYEKLTDRKQTPLSVWEQNPDYQKLVAEGMSPQDAIKDIATTKARMAAAVVAPLGLLGYMGAEAAIASRGLGKATAEALTLRGAGKLFAKDNIGEQLEEGGTQFGGNVVARTVDPSQELTDGVAQAMGTAAVTSAPFSAAGALSQYREAAAGVPEDRGASRVAVDLLNPQNYDPTLIDPAQTTRAGEQTVTPPADPTAPLDPQRARQVELETIERGGTSFTYPTVGGEPVTVEIPEGRQLSDQERTELGDLRMAGTRMTSFTEPGSATDQAGLTPLVVPLADAPVALPAINPSTEQQFGLDKLRMGTTDVSRTGDTGAAAGVGGIAGSDQPGGGVDVSGPDATGAGQLAGDNAGLPATNAGANVPAGDSTGQPPAGVTPAENNNAVVEPAEQWFGRKGDGYVTQGDAQQALPGRQRMFPTLDWKVETMANGKFRLAGYSTAQETNLGTQTTQAIEGQTQGQQAPAVAGTASAGVGQPMAAGGATQAQDGDVGGVNQLAAGPVVQPQPAGALATAEGAQSAGLTASLRLAPPAPLRAVGKAIKSLKADAGIDAEIDNAPMNEKQQAASAVARMLGRTVTILKSDKPGSLPNGFMIKGDDKNIYIANDTEDAPLSVAMHEIYHTMPDAQRKALNAQLLPLFRGDKRGEFAGQFQYDPKNDALLDEEIPAFMVQAISKREDFWQELRTKMGNAEFAEVAKTILAKLNTIISGSKAEYGDEFVNKYITDVAKARDLLSTAYAEAMQAQGFMPDADLTGEVVMARRAKTDKVGDYEVATAKDGSLTVYGDGEAIRAAMPEGVVGRVTKEGVVFTNAAAPRVRAALEGRNIAYSRGGQVTEKLPMKDGKYLGAPAKFNTPGKIPTLRKILRQLADEGAPGRYWYENSGKEVLKMVGGDVQEARKFVALLAIYSPQAKVDANSTFALRAWAQYKAGQPISVKTGVMDKKAKAALDNVDEFWSGEKTGNFFFNLLREIDPSTEGKQGATIDMWMMRAGQYDNDAPTATQYSFMENETNRLAQDLGWEPQQVQAAIWVAMKARMENSGVKKATEKSSEKKGWIRYDYPLKNGKPVKTRVIIDAQKHRDNWLKHSFEHDVTKDDTQQAKFDFGDGLKRHIGQVSFEARPGRTTSVLPGIHSAPYAQQVEFQQAVQAAFLDENGADTLAQMLGLLVDSSDMLAPNVWRGEVTPSTQKQVAMAPSKGDAGKTSVDPAQADALNLYAAVAGLVARQEGVGWHRPFYSSTKRDANGLDIDLGRVINPAEMADVQRAVATWMSDNGVTNWQDKFGFVSSPSGIRLVNFGIITNEKLQSDILKVAESVLPDFDYRVFASSGAMPTNNWKENPNGESYVQRLGAAGRSDVLDWARAVLAPRVDAVFKDFSERYDWGDAGKLQFSNRAGDGSGRQGIGGTQDRSVQAAERANAQAVERLKPTDALPGAPQVKGFTGPDPRLVAVAEQYARDNGITLRRQAEYVKVDPERAARIAEAYDAMQHTPQDLRVKAAYKELIAQTLAQYRALEKAGYKFWFINTNKPENLEYASSPWNAMRDIRANKTMGVFPTDDGFGSSDFDPASNPLLEDTGITWPSGSMFGPRKRVLANDLFRAVHDAFGHGLEGAGFRADGEENAWQAHVRLFKGAALGAITSETRGQNSWLNYGPYGEQNRNAKVEDTIFADQKTGLMPEWTWSEGRVGDMGVMASNRALEDRGVNAMSRLAFQGYVNAEVPRVQAARKMAGILAKLDAGKITPQEFELQVRLLAGKMAEVSSTKAANKIVSERQRGADIVREKLLAARRRGEIDPYQTEFAMWALDKNPAMAVGLGITVRDAPVASAGAAGDYNPANEIMRVFKYTANTTTAVHEILHHTERMMPAEVQDGIRKEWAKAYTKALATAEPKLREALELIPQAMTGGKDARDAVMKAFSLGVLNREKHYQLVNPSEFWAVNATDILQRRFESTSWIAKAKAWMAEFVQKAKGLVGMRSNASVLRGLEAVLNGEGERVSKKMLTDMGSFNDIVAPDTAAFKKWFGDSKIVDADGKPMLMYHGTDFDFSVFRPSFRGALFVTPDPEFAVDYTTTSLDTVDEKESSPNIMPVYVRAENPFDYDNPEHVEKAIDYLRRTNLFRGVQPGWFEGGRWENMEDRNVQRAIKSLGFDSFYINEFGVKNLGVYNSSQIKSAIGNDGNFDATNPDIRRSNRSTEGWVLSRDETGRFRFGAGAKAYRYSADIANAVLDKMGMKPISQDLSRAMRKMKAEIAKAQEITVGVATNLQELSEQERTMISDVIEGELKRGSKPPQRVLEVAASMQSIMSEQTAELVRLGMLSEDAAGRWDGKYLPRFYESKLGDETKAWAKAAKALLGRKKTMQGIGGSSLKGRGLFQSIPVEELETWLAEGWEERDPNFDPATDEMITVWRDYARTERDDMGEIRDAMFRFVMGYNKSQRDVSLGRLYENLANTVASKTEQPGYVQVPSTNIEDTYARRYGKLAGKWVPQEVLDHLSAFDTSMQNDLLKMYLKGLSMWKEGKTVLNPVSHANNVMSNVTMAHFAGVSYWDVNKYIAATRDLIKNDPMVQEAKDAGLFGGTMTQAELVNLMPDQLKVLAAKTESKAAQGVDQLWTALSFWLRKPMGKAYEAEDLFFRYLIYRDARGQGLDVDGAIDYAQKYIFTYDDLPKGARIARDFALPFFAYTYKVVPTLAETALEKPWRYAAPAAAIYTINAAMYAMAASLGGGDDEDWWEVIKRYVTDEDFRNKARELEKQERKNLPDWMKGASMTLGTSKAIRLGMDDLTNLPVFLDVSRIFPGGDLFDAHNNAGGVPLIAPIMPNNPILTTASAILYNKDTFRGTEVVKQSDTDEEATKKRAAWAWKQFAPAVAIGNYHFDRAMNVIANTTGQPVNLGFAEYTGTSNDGLPVQPKYAAMQTVGIKARPIDLDTSEQIQKAEIKKLITELEAEMRRARRLESKGAITPAESERIQDKQREKRQRLRDGMTVDGDERE